MTALDHFHNMLYGGTIRWQLHCSWGIAGTPDSIYLGHE